MEQKTWRIDRWPPLAWLETGLKFAGMVFGFGALGNAIRAERLIVPEGNAFLPWLVLIILSIGLFAAIADRLKEREIIAMAFVILNNLAHWGMVLGLMSGVDVGLRPFAVLFLVGDIVKLIFIRLHKFQVREYGPRTLYFLTGVYIAGYFLLLISS